MWVWNKFHVSADEARPINLRSEGISNFFDADSSPMVILLVVCSPVIRKQLSLLKLRLAKISEAACYSTQSPQKEKKQNKIIILTIWRVHVFTEQVAGSTRFRVMTWQLPPVCFRGTGELGPRLLFSETFSSWRKQNH